MTMFPTVGNSSYAYQRLRPCVDLNGHHFQATPLGVICCTRCGTTPADARV